MAETETTTESIIDWGYLDALVKDSLPTKSWTEKTELGFEQVAMTEAKIVFLTDRLKTPSVRGQKRTKIQYQLDDLKLKLAKLKAGHEAGAKVIRQKAMGLAALPREMRDAILEQIYVQDKAIEVTWSRLGNNFVFYMPKDEALYMSSLHVGPALAQEAAEMFYQKNTFAFVRAASGQFCCYNPGFSNWDQTQLEAWFARDHYGSGVVASDFVRTLEIRLDPPGYLFNDALQYSWGNPTNEVKVCSHFALESMCENARDDWQDYRSRLRTFLQYRCLQQVRLVISYAGDHFDALVRIANPYAREARAVGIKVTLEERANATEHTAAHDLELSDVFEAPSDEDYAAYFARTQRGSIFVDVPERDIFDTWKLIVKEKHAPQYPCKEMVNAYHPETVSRGFVRVWLHEHYEMHKFWQRDRKAYHMVEDMAQQIKELSPEERQLRKRLYAEVADFLE